MARWKEQNQKYGEHPAACSRPATQAFLGGFLRMMLNYL